METRLITLNSEDAQKLNDDYNSNLFFNIPNIVDESPDIIHLEVSLDSATIPVSWYLINDSNNTLHYNYNSLNDSIVLTNGNYNGTTLITEIQNRFLDKTISMNVVLSQITGKLTFTISTPITNITFFYNLSRNLMRILGFIDTVSFTSVICPRPMNLLGIQKIQICSNSLASISSFSSSTRLSNTVIQSIPVDVPSFHQITYLSSSPHYGRMKSRYLSNVDLQLLDEFGTFIEMNGIEFTACFLIRIFRKYKVEHDTIKIPPPNKPNEENKEEEDVKDPELELLLEK